MRHSYLHTSLQKKDLISNKIGRRRPEVEVVSTELVDPVVLVTQAGRCFVVRLSMWGLPTFEGKLPSHCQRTTMCSM